MITLILFPPPSIGMLLSRCQKQSYINLNASVGGLLLYCHTFWSTAYTTKLICCPDDFTIMGVYCSLLLAGMYISSPALIATWRPLNLLVTEKYENFQVCISSYQDKVCPWGMVENVNKQNKNCSTPEFVHCAARSPVYTALPAIRLLLHIVRSSTLHTT